MASGDRITPLGFVDLSFNLKSLKAVKQRFIVADIDVPAVIGYDFLYNHGCTIDIKRSSITIRGDVIECELESRMPSLFRISIKDPVTIPSMSEKIVMAKVEGDSSSTIAAIVGPNQNLLANTILVARAVIDPSRMLVPIRFLNITQEPKELYPDNLVASCERFDSIGTTNQQIADSDKSSRICTMSSDVGSNQNTTVTPSHLQDLFSSIEVQD